MKLTKSILLSFALMTSSVSAFAESVIETRIVGGTEVPNSTKYPWMVLLSESTNPADFFCGGSLIAEQWVLTAAHCMIDQYGNVSAPAWIKAFVGEYDKTDGTPGASSVSEIHVHPGYDSSTSDNDIALIKLSSPASGATTLTYVNPALATQLAVNDDVTVIGWGDTETAVAYPDVLREVTMPLVSNSTCNSGLGGQVTDNMLCAGLSAGGVDSCQGDSGGPLVFTTDGGATWLQAGIVSWGIGCADPNNYGVYTRVENYSDWIDLKLQGIEVSPYIKMGTWIVGRTGIYTLELSNAASNPSFTINSISTGTANFSVTNDTCTGTVSAGETCTVTLAFTANLTGSFSDSLTIDSSLSIGVFSLPLTAEVITESFLSPNVASSSILDWAVDGNAFWTEEQVTTDGAYSFQSGVITDNQTSSLYAYVNIGTGQSPQNYYFDWKVCAEQDYDYLELWIDNVKQSGISGDTDWNRQTIQISGEGDHTIEWRFKKDYACSAGADQGWVANIYDEASLPVGLPLPVHSTSCDLSNIRPLQLPCANPPPPSGGGGAMSAWFYLGLGVPLLFRRRRN